MLPALFSSEDGGLVCVYQVAQKVRDMAMFVGRGEVNSDNQVVRSELDKISGMGHSMTTMALDRNPWSGIIMDVRKMGKILQLAALV